MKKIMANNGRSQIAAKGGVVSTQVLIYQALHDVFNFSKKRLDALTARVNQYYQDGYTNDITPLRNRLDEIGIDFQLERDFIKNLKKALGANGRSEYNGVEAGSEATYILAFNALHDLCGFGKERLQRVQKKIKFYVWCLLDETLDVMIVDYMQCLHVECGQYFDTLVDFTKRFGTPDIYGGNPGRKAVIV